MGVPAFFRWLTRKYPSVVVHCVEEKSVNVDGTSIPIDSSAPNPNGVEFDNLYLDMNGIIHPCTHPENKPAPKDEDEMMVAIFECIDRLFRIVRPRKLLYMAIDGVAPRAKMNQQRSRRFRAAKESVEKIAEMDRCRAEIISQGGTLPPPKPKGEHFDSNCITPGTPFMTRLSKCLHYYIHDRLNNDPGWKGIKVILSDANVPGEGEHKIMDYIRKQRAQPDHDPNTQHCLCGADADLIMLGLATHEPNFVIIREELKMNAPRPCDLCGQIGHEMKECMGLAANEADVPVTFGSENEFIFVRLSVLREYLQRELYMENLPFTYDFERAVDDWVFMCFFVGNDFLPHLPSLEIHENAIDRLIRLYKDAVYKTGGWLTDSGDCNLERVQLIMTQLGYAEDRIFKQRQEKTINNRRRAKERSNNPRGNRGGRGGGGRGGGQFNNDRPNWSIIKGTQFEPTAIGSQKALTNVRIEAYQMRKAGMHTDASSGQEGSQQRGVKRPHPDNEEEDPDKNDEVRLWEDGFKDRYYESKFDVGPENVEFRYNVALHYVRGLCWVLRYYYQGCASWKWYFPYHYAPFASDFVNISGLSTEFEKDTAPFNPLEQLMSVFPAASCKHVPEPWAELMNDIESPIIDFYPEDFKIDLNGKRYAWQGVALLPFVDETRLFDALKPYYDRLTEDEIKRNMRGDNRLYMANAHSSSSHLSALYEQELDENEEVAVSIEGMRGTILVAKDCVRAGGKLKSPISSLPTVKNNDVVVARYRDPQYGRDFIFPAVRLKGAKSPPACLKPTDLSPQENQSWRPQIGMAPSKQRAYLPDSSHRFVNHYAPKPQGGNRNFSTGGGGGGGGYRGGGRGGGNHYNQDHQQKGPYRGGRGGGGGYHQQFNRNAPHPYNNRGRGGGGGYGGGYSGGNSSGYRSQKY